VVVGALYETEKVSRGQSGVLHYVQCSLPSQPISMCTDKWGMKPSLSLSHFAQCVYPASVTLCIVFLQRG
jgi:hypothetical protein